MSTLVHKPTETGNTPPAGKIGEIRHDSKIRILWDRWTWVVMLFAHQRPRNAKMEQNYNQLYLELLEECRKLSEATPGSSRMIFHYITDLVRPWLSCQTFLQVDREILGDLLRRCQEVDELLRGSTKRKFLRKMKPFVMVVAIAGLALAVVFSWNLWHEPLLEWFERTRYLVRFHVSRIPLIYQWLIAGTIVVVVTYVVMSRMRRD